MFTGEKVTDHIHRSIKKVDAKQWFGVDPPDLSLEYNAKGGKWLYNYLLSFYKDEKRPWGVNNLVFMEGIFSKKIQPSSTVIFKTSAIFLFLYFISKVSRLYLRPLHTSQAI